MIKNTMISYRLGIIALSSSSESGINDRDMLFQVLIALEQEYLLKLKREVGRRSGRVRTTNFPIFFTFDGWPYAFPITSLPFNFAECFQFVPGLLNLFFPTMRCGNGGCGRCSRPRNLGREVVAPIKNYNCLLLFMLVFFTPVSLFFRDGKIEAAVCGVGLQTLDLVTDL